MTDDYDNDEDKDSEHHHHKLMIQMDPFKRAVHRRYIGLEKGL